MGWVLSRRQLLRSSGLATAALLAGCAPPWQEPPARRTARVGFLSTGMSAASPPAEAFRRGLRELGYVEGQNLAIEFRASEMQAERLAAVSELVRMPVDVIVAAVTTVEETRQVTSTVPIVMVYPSDPVANGVVASLARPGGNVTGLTYFAGQLSAKRLQLLTETVPGLTRVAVIQQADRATLDRDYADLQSVADPLGVQLLRLDVREAGELEAAFDAATSERADALLVGGAQFFSPSRSELVALAAKHRLPASYFVADFARAGGLMAYSANVSATFHRAAAYVDRILKGANPSDLPIEQPTELEFVINLGTARALGLTIPEHVLVRATQVIP